MDLPDSRTTLAHRASKDAVRLANKLAGAPAFASAYPGSVASGLHAVVTGDGPAIIFLHGFPSFWFCWIRQMEVLRGQYRVIALDAPGAGASARSQSPNGYRIDVLAERIVDAVRAIGERTRPILVGHDWGAALGFAIAQAYPELLAGVIGIAAPPYNVVRALLESDAEQRERSAYMTQLRAMTLEQAATAAPNFARTAYAGLRERGDLVPEEADLLEGGCADPGAFHAGAMWYRANISDDEEPVAFARWPEDDAPLAIPAMLIWGENDRTFVDRAATRFAEANPNAHVLRLPGVGHWAMLQSPIVVTSAIERFSAACFEAVGA